MVGKAKIKVNGRIFNSIAVANNYIKIFTFGKNYFHIQIDIVENYKKQILIRLIAYTRLATKFLFDKSSKENRWTKKQFTEVLKLFLAIKLTVTNQRNKDTPALSTDYYKQLETSYCREGQRKIQKPYGFEAYSLYYIFAYRRVCCHMAGTKFLYFPMYVRKQKLVKRPSVGFAYRLNNCTKFNKLL